MAIRKHKTKPKVHRILYTRNRTNTNRKQPNIHSTQHKKNIQRNKKTNTTNTPKKHNTNHLKNKQTPQKNFTNKLILTQPL